MHFRCLSSFACFSTSSGFRRMFQQSGRYSFNSRCHPSSCIVAVFAMSLGSSSAISSSRHVWNVPPFHTVLLYISSTKTTQTLPRASPLPFLFWRLLCTIEVTFPDIVNIFHIWSTLASYEEITVGFGPIANLEITSPNRCIIITIIGWGCCDIRNQGLGKSHHLHLPRPYR